MKLLKIQILLAVVLLGNAVTMRGMAPRATGAVYRFGRPTIPASGGLRRYYRGGNEEQELADLNAKVQESMRKKWQLEQEQKKQEESGGWLSWLFKPSPSVPKEKEELEEKERVWENLPQIIEEHHKRLAEENEKKPSFFNTQWRKWRQAIKDLNDQDQQLQSEEKQAELAEELERGNKMGWDKEWVEHTMRSELIKVLPVYAEGVAGRTLVENALWDWEQSGINFLDWEPIWREKLEDFIKKQENRDLSREEYNRQLIKALMKHDMESTDAKKRQRAYYNPDYYNNYVEGHEIYEPWFEIWREKGGQSDFFTIKKGVFMFGASREEG